MPKETGFLDTIAQNTAQAEIPIVRGFICIVLFLRFNRHEGKNEANRFLGYCLGIGFLMLVIFRIYKGVI